MLSDIVDGLVGAEAVKEMVVQHSFAKQIHAQLAKEGVCAGLQFSDTWKDYMTDISVKTSAAHSKPNHLVLRA